jgi:hypothetical protein
MIQQEIPEDEMIEILDDEMMEILDDEHDDLVEQEDDRQADEVEVDELRLSCRQMYKKIYVRSEIVQIVIMMENVGYVTKSTMLPMNSLHKHLQTHCSSMIK